MKSKEVMIIKKNNQNQTNTKIISLNKFILKNKVEKVR